MVFRTVKDRFQMKRTSVQRFERNIAGNVSHFLTDSEILFIAKVMHLSKYVEKSNQQEIHGSGHSCQ